jgi:putative transposase
MSELVHRGHVIRLDPTAKQAKALARAAGVSRFTYNWALSEWSKQYKDGKKPNALALKKQFNSIKAIEFPWIMESPRDANSQPFADLGVAFKNFFASCSGKRKGRKMGYPTFRRRGIDDSFYVANDKFSVRTRSNGRRGIVRLPVIGEVRTFEAFRYRGKVLSGRVYRKAEQWFIAVSSEVEDSIPHVHEHEIIGVDLGLKTAAVTSHGEEFTAPRPLRSSLRKLVRASRTLSRRQKGGSNRNKARMHVARIHRRITDIRKDFWHKVTTRLCRENQVVVVEDLVLCFMFKNKKLARVAADVGLGMFRPMMQYKATVRGGSVVVADRFFPSTQRCSSCGNIKEGDEKMLLGMSEYVCEKCGVVEDRDLNAAKNLEQYPRLSGNWRKVPPTPMDDCASTRRPRRASAVAEVGTKPCSLVGTH